MIQHGEPPYLEASTKGDMRFSALVARIAGRDFDTIEELYQGKKRFADGSTGLYWRAAKGRKAENQGECAEFYEQLWREYINENPYLIEVLVKATGISDIYGQKGSCCQATTLWKLREEFINKPPWG